MPVVRSTFACLAASLLLLVAGPAAAEARSHLGAAPGQILDLRGGAVNDGIATPLELDIAGPNSVVPGGSVFVATDVQIQSNTLDPSQLFLVFVNFDNAQQRSLYAPFVGVGYSESFTTGFVAPSGTTLTVVNMAGSDGSVIVGVQGSLMRATAAPVNAAPF